MEKKSKCYYSQQFDVVLGFAREKTNAEERKKRIMNNGLN